MSLKIKISTVYSFSRLFLVHSQASYYRNVIVYVTLASSIMGLAAVVAMKLTELFLSKNTLEEDDEHVETHYGAIQNGKGE